MAAIGFTPCRVRCPAAAIGGGLLAIMVGCAETGPDAGPVVHAAWKTAHTAAINPEAPELSASKRLMAQGRYADAVDELTRAIVAAGHSQPILRIDQHGADLFFQRGLAYLHMGFPDTAAADLSDAIKLAPRYGDAFEVRGKAYFNLGDSFKALRDLTQAIRMKTDNAAAYLLRGEVYLARGQYARAAADLEQAEREDAALATAARDLRSRAYLLWSQQLDAEGDQVLAAEKLALARELNPSYAAELPAAAAQPSPPVEQSAAKPVVTEADQLLAAGRQQQLARQFDQALSTYTRALSLRPDFAQAYLRRGETLLAMGFPDTALEDLKRAAHREPSAEALELQAEAFLELGSPHRASLAATEALHLAPGAASAYALRGRAYLQAENWKRALADLQEAIRLEPQRRAQLEPLLAQARRHLAAAAQQ